MPMYDVFGTCVLSEDIGNNHNINSFIPHALSLLQCGGIGSYGMVMVAFHIYGDI